MSQLEKVLRLAPPNVKDFIRSAPRAKESRTCFRLVAEHCG